MTRLPSLPRLSPQSASLAARAQARAQQRVTEEEQNSLLGQIMGGVAAVGNVIDLPGSSARDVLTGRNPFDQWAPWNWTSSEHRTGDRQMLEDWGIAPPNTPGLDWWDVAGFAAGVATDPLTWITGPLGTLPKAAQATKAATRLLSKNDDLSKAAAAGMEIIAKRAAGEIPAAAKNVDEAVKLARARTLTPGSRPHEWLPNTPAAIADQVRHGERGVIGVRAPFSKKQLLSFGAGNKFIPGMMDRLFYGDAATGAGKIAKAISAPIRAARHFTSASAGYKHASTEPFTGAAQLAKDLAYAERQGLQAGVENLMPHLHSDRVRLESEYNDILAHFQNAGDQASFDQVSRYAVEMGGAFDDMENAARGAHDIRRAVSELAGQPDEALDMQAQGQLFDQWSEYMTTQKVLQDEAWKRAVDLGFDGDELTDDFAEYFTRRGPHAGMADLSKARKRVLKNVPGGSVRLNQMSRDPAITAVERTAKSKAARAAGAREFLRQQNLPSEGRGWTDDTLLDNFLYAKHIQPEVDRIIQRGGELLLDGNVVDAAQYATGIRTKWMTPTVKTLAKGAKKSRRRAPVRLLREYMETRNKQVLTDGLFPNLEIEDWANYMGGMLGLEANLRGMHHVLQKPGVLKAAGSEEGLIPLNEAFATAGYAQKGWKTLLTNLGRSENEVTKLAVRPEVVAMMKAFRESGKPRELSALGKVWDKVINSYKGLLVLSPGFHTRNVASGTFQSLSDGPVNAVELAGGLAEAAKHLFSKGHIPEYFDEARHIHVFGTRAGQYADQVGQAAAEAAARTPTHISELVTPFKRLTKERAAWNPVGWRGVQVHPHDVGEYIAKHGEAPKLNALAEAHENAYSIVEFVNRYGYYHALRKKGLSPAQSAHHVRRAQFDYSELSRWEKDVARRYGPLFYGWQRKSIPYTLLKIAERPGGLTSQTIKAVSAPQRAGSDNDTYIPGFLRERMAIPYKSDEQTGETSFVTASGLPVEDLNLFSLQGTPGETLERTGQKLAAQLPPPISAPLSWMTGKDMYTGRPLEYLKSPTQGAQEAVGIENARAMPWLDRILHMLPTSRQQGMLGQITDPRKSVLARIANIATGVRTSTYDTKRYQVIDALERLRALADDDPAVRAGGYQYIPESEEARALPETAERLRRIRELQRLLQTQ